jgi:hypothetical protein
VIEWNVEDFLRGTNFLSASGGGDPVIERRLLHEDLDRGLSLGWQPLDPTSDGLVCTACWVHGVSVDLPVRRVTDRRGCNDVGVLVIDQGLVRRIESRSW